MRTYAVTMVATRFLTCVVEAADEEEAEAIIGGSAPDSASHETMESSSIEECGPEEDEEPGSGPDEPLAGTPPGASSPSGRGDRKGGSHGEHA